MPEKPPVSYWEATLDTIALVRAHHRSDQEASNTLLEQTEDPTALFNALVGMMIGFLRDVCQTKAEVLTPADDPIKARNACVEAQLDAWTRQATQGLAEAQERGIQGGDDQSGT